MKRIKYHFFLFLFFIMYGCQEYYMPEIEKFPPALVVEGMLTDQNDYTKIKLSRSESFNERSYYYGETKARVSIESESGQSYPASEISGGIYQTMQQVPTSVGEGYYLKIITAKGDEYRSEIEKMMTPTPIDSIYLTDSTFRDISYDFLGDPIVKDYTGITISVLPRVTSSTEEVGFLYKWNALVNFYISVDFSTLYCWKELSSELVYVYDFVQDNYINELPMVDIHSLSEYTLSPYSIDSFEYSKAMTQYNSNSSSFYYHLRQYSITSAGSKFWRSVKNQSEVSGKLFDPVEEQIIGNIRCVNDSTKKAFGYFNTASFAEKVICVILEKYKHKTFKTVTLMPVPINELGCVSGKKPEFWY
jgi:hypothetical protein